MATALDSHMKEGSAAASAEVTVKKRQSWSEIFSIRWKRYSVDCARTALRSVGVPLGGMR
jgi:hypothetical protein